MAEAEDKTTTTPEELVPEQKAASFASPPEVPTQEAVNGIRFDFNFGLRIAFPEEGLYRCLFRDLDSGLVLYCMDVQPNCTIVSVKRFFVRFELEIYSQADLEKPIFRHDLDLAGQDVLLQLPAGALGDAIAWFSYVERFQEKHDCRLYCSMAKEIADLFREQYPDINFITKEEAAKLKPYASYCLGLFFGSDSDNQPYDFRLVGLHRTAGHILGLSELSDIPPRVNLNAERKIKEKYAVIATQASSQAKYWNNPSGWRELVNYLKSQGYRVLCIDKQTEYGMDFTWNKIPWGCEDFTGERPLQERIDLIKDADVFIGLSSGLSWLAWCCRVPVVLISGFTDPVNEFATPYRVINPAVCHGCWNDMRCQFDHLDFLWCPRKKKAAGKFECTKAITAQMAIRAVERALSEKRQEEVKYPEKMLKPYSLLTATINNGEAQ